jgi:hypothetical protein
MSLRIKLMLALLFTGLAAVVLIGGISYMRVYYKVQGRFLAARAGGRTFPRVRHGLTEQARQLEAGAVAEPFRTCMRSQRGQQAGAPAAAPAPAPLREYHALALSGAGDRIVALESSDPGGLPLRPHASVVVRGAASGAVLHDYDPCPDCAYNCPNWSPDGQRVAFIGVDNKAGTATLYVAGQGRVEALLSLKGVASRARWSPDGATLALLATPDARKLAGAVEAGVHLVGDMRRRMLAWFARYLAPVSR